MLACDELLGQGVEIRYRDIWQQTPAKPKTTRSKYTCHECGLKMWGKPGVDDLFHCQQAMTEEA
jgi:hypothetical protein